MVTTVGKPRLSHDVLSSRPEANSEEVAGDETAGEEVDGGGICTLVSIEGKAVQGALEHGLTAPELGGDTLQSDPTVQPLGSPEGILVQVVVTTEAVAEPYQGKLVVAVVSGEVAPLLPNASGALPEAAEVTAGADAVFEGVSEPDPSELIWPPDEVIDCHVPAVPEYEYWLPVE